MEVHAGETTKNPSLTFSMTDADGIAIEVDAGTWRYALLRFDDGSLDIILEQGNMAAHSEGDRWSAAIIVLDGLLGEERRLSQITDVEPVVALEIAHSRKASSVSVLAAHLDSLDRRSALSRN